MSKIKNIWKENKIAVLFFTVVILIILVLFLMIYPLYSTRSGDEYGDRLDGIKDVALKDSVNDDIEKYFEDTGKTKTVKANLKGKLYNIYIKVNDDVDVNEIADLSANIFSNFDEDQLKFYDIQIFIVNENVENPKTIVGYKNKKSENFIWTNNK